MSFRHTVLMALAPFLLLSAAFANEKDAEAKALIEHAKQLSDIRVEGAPAFKLRINFKIIAKNGSATEGEYTEVWVSKVQWRKDTVAGPFRRVEVVNDRKRWLLDGTTPMPEHLRDVDSLYDFEPLPPAVWKPRKISDRERKGLKVRCVETDVESLCFDKTDGTLAYQVTSRLWMYPRENACFYSDNQKFDGHLLARSYSCTENKKVTMEAKVVELGADSAPDQALFTPPEGAKESVNCLGHVQPPKMVRGIQPILPRPSHGEDLVVISMLVGTDGKPRDFKVLSPSNQDYDQQALEAVKLWLFKPGMCDKEPTEMTITVELEFHLF